MSFNEAQTEAIHHKEGPLLIIAGSRIGKNNSDRKSYKKSN